MPYPYAYVDLIVNDADWQVVKAPMDLNYWGIVNKGPGILQVTTPDRAAIREFGIGAGPYVLAALAAFVPAKPNLPTTRFFRWAAGERIVLVRCKPDGPTQLTVELTFLV